MITVNGHRYRPVATVPSGLVWHTPRHLQGQILETSYSHPYSVPEAGPGCMYRRVIDRSIVGSEGRPVAYYWKLEPYHYAIVSDRTPERASVAMVCETESEVLEQQKRLGMRRLDICAVRRPDAFTVGERIWIVRSDVEILPTPH